MQVCSELQFLEQQSYSPELDSGLAQIWAVCFSLVNSVRDNASFNVFLGGAVRYANVTVYSCECEG